MELEKEIQQKQFSSPKEKMVINILFTNNWLHRRHDQVFRPHGLSSQQYNILRILRGQHPKPASVNLLIDRMLDKSSNASRLVDKLQKKELVERKVCATDRRQVDVLITKQGLDLLQKLDQEMSSVERGFENLTNEEAEKLNFLLDKLRG